MSDQLDKLLPTHGPTGSPVENYELSYESGVEMVHLGPPGGPPERDIYSVDDDGHLVFVRTRSDDELAEALADYEKYMETYTGTGFVQAGAGVWSRKVKCLDGIEAKGTWSGSGWRWSSYGPPEKQPDHSHKMPWEP